MRIRKINLLLIRYHLGSYLVQIDTHYVKMGITLLGYVIVLVVELYL